MDINQADRDGTLMAQVPAQVQNLKGAEMLEVLRQQSRLGRLRGTIVDQQDLNRHTGVFQGVIERGQQQRQGVPVIENRDENYQPTGVFLVHFRR
jgi:hypothetical protein